jgi:hypothetical protein
MHAIPRRRWQWLPGEVKHGIRADKVTRPRLVVGAEISGDDIVAAAQIQASQGVPASERGCELSAKVAPRARYNNAWPIHHG